MTTIDETQSLKAGLIEYWKKPYRHASTASYLVLLFLLFYVLAPTLRGLILDRVFVNEWGVRGSCDAACVKTFVDFNFGFVLLTLSSTLAMAWGPVFYWINRKSPQQKGVLAMMRVEALLLFMIGTMVFCAYFIAVSKRDGWTRYFDEWKNFQNGTYVPKKKTTEAPLSS